MQVSYRDENGSIQVIEMSYVLPVAMLVVISLMYLAFGMFMYVHSFNLAGLAADDFGHSVGKEGLYWQLSGEYLSKEKQKAITDDLQLKLDNISVFPGMDFLAQSRVTTKEGKPFVSVRVTCSYFGKRAYSVLVDRTIYTPVEFVNSVDIFTKDNFEEMKEIYDEFS